MPGRPLSVARTSTPGMPEPDPAQADVVRDVVARVRRGEALTKIAAGLNEAGVRPRRGVAWTHTGLARLLDSPALGGMVRVGGELRPARFRGVIASEEWHTARQALLRRPRGDRRRPRESLTLLGGILTCHEHDRPCYGSWASHAPIYQVLSPGVCSVSVVRHAADELIGRLVVARLGDTDANSALRADPENSATETEIEELHRRREEIADMVADGLLSAPVARSRLVRLSERIAAAERNRGPAMIDPDAFVAPAEAWARWTAVQRRDVLRILFAKIAIRHVGFKNGSRAKAERFVVEWN
jgi:site-specific DNA recombinase